MANEGENGTNAGANGAGAGEGGAAAGTGGGAGDGAGAGTGGGAGTPAGGVPPTGGQAASRQAGKPPATAAKPGSKNIVIPESEFKKRLERETVKQLATKLGISREDAAAILSGEKKLVPAGSAPAAAAPGAAPAAAAPVVVTDPKIIDRLSRVERDNRELSTRLAKSKEKVKKVRERERDKRVTLEIRHNALAVGVVDKYADFALDLFMKACRKDPKIADDERGYFTTLKTDYPFLFAGGAPAAAAPTVPLRPTTAGPASTQPGEVKPNPAAAGTPPTEQNVDKMTDDEFREYKKQKYGSRY